MEDATAITQALVIVEHAKQSQQEEEGEPSMAEEPSHTLVSRNPCEAEEHYVVVSNLIDQKPVQALVLLAKSTARCKIPDFPQHSNFKSLVEMVDVLAYVLGRVHSGMKPEEDDAHALPKPALRCFQKLFEVLCRARSLLESCSGGSRIATLLLSDVVALEFCDLTEELHDRLRPFPWELFGAGRPELKNLMDYVMGKCATQKVHIDRVDMELRGEVESEVEAIQRRAGGGLPDHGRVARLFEKLGVVAVEGQVSEVMVLESEMKRRRELLPRRPGLEELLRYCKLVFLWGSWPESPTVYQRNPRLDWVLPPQFRCPITMAAMRDPVTVSTGQTYERSNIERWLRAGHRLCPVTHRLLDEVDDATVATNPAVQRQINAWVEQHGINLKLPEEVTPRMVASYLAERLAAASPASLEGANPVLSRVTARLRWDAKLAVQMGEAGVVPVLLRYLLADDPELRANAMAALHELSVVGANKTRIMEEGHGCGVIAIIELLKEQGATWEARGHAAGTLYQLSTVRAYHWCLAREGRVVEGMVQLAREAPGTQVRGKGLAGVLQLGSDRVRVQEMKLLLKQCKSGELEAVVRVVAVDPVLRLVRNLRDTSPAWRKRKLRRTAGALLDACMEWVWRWGPLTGPGFLNEDK